MSGGGGTNTIQSSQPNSIVAPYLGQLYQGGFNQYQTGGPQVFSGSETSPFTGQQVTGLNNMLAASSGQNVNDLTALQQQAQGTGGQLAGGTTSGQGTLGAIGGGTAGGQGTLGTIAGGGGNANTLLQGIMNGQGIGQSVLGGIANGSNVGMQGLQGIINGSNAGVQALQQTLNPNYTNVANNPNLQAAMKAANYNTTLNYTNAVMPAMASQFASAGRFGSGAQAQDTNMANNTLATQISNTNSGLANQDYMQMLAQQSANAGTLGNLQSGASQAYGSLAGTAANQYAGNQSTAANDMNGAQINAGTNLVNSELQGAGSLVNSQLAGNAALPGLAGLNYGNATQQFGAGSAIQGQQQTTLNNLINQFNQQQQQPYQNTQWLSSLLSGLPYTQTGSSQNQVNPYSTAAGLGLTGASLYNSGALTGMGSLLGGGSTAGAFGTPLFTAAVGGAGADAGGMSALMGLGGSLADLAPLAAA